MVRIDEYVFLCSVSWFFKCIWFYRDIQNVWFEEVVNLVNLLLKKALKSKNKDRC